MVYQMPEKRSILYFGCESHGARVKTFQRLGSISIPATSGAFWGTEHMMKMRVWLAILLAWVGLTWSAAAQQSNQELVWVQIEAQPSLVEAEERVRDYAALLSDVNGFSIGGGWYAVALGPYDRATAGDVLRQLRAQGLVPRDSYIAETRSYRQQFWPIGANVLLQAQAETAQAATAPEVGQRPLAQTQEESAAAPDAETAEDSVQQETQGAETQEVQTPPDPDETLREARASERQLNRDQRKTLQIALKWAGFYTAAIDGAYGPGTRRSMSAWQEANDWPVTGVLTTGQRAQLMAQYNAVLEGLDLTLVEDSQTGIAMQVPLGVVTFDAYQAPFARYNASGDDGIRLLQISQPGDQRRLFGLYDILQTLEVIPLDGPRERRRDGFSITGTNKRIISQTEVTLRDGEIKGFILIWPQGDEDRRTRALAEIEKSFQRIPGVLAPEVGAEAEQSVDLVAGLNVRKPLKARSGFYVSRSGHVVTSQAAIEGCGSLTLDETYSAEAVASNAGTGLALLQPKEALAPQQIAALGNVSPRLTSEIAVSGFSYGGRIGAPTMTFGTLTDARGLSGEEHLDLLNLASLEGDEGGPVLDRTGAVVGVLQPKSAEGRLLPEDVALASDVDALRAFVRDAGLTPLPSASEVPLAPEDLAAKGAAFTVLVSCWE